MDGQIGIQLRLPLRGSVMYHSFEIKNFRGLENLTIEGLERINLIAGKNNVGKTALLEALWIHHGAVIPELALRVDSFRGLDAGDSQEFMGNLFLALTTA
jgi:AAA15 family ATPase/GTPase